MASAPATTQPGALQSALHRATPGSFLLTACLLSLAVVGHLAYFVSKHTPFHTEGEVVVQVISFPARASTATACAGLALVVASMVGFMTWTGRMLGLSGVALYFYRADAIFNP